MKIAVFGAGSIGVYVGGSLLAAGGDVVLIGRASVRDRILRNGLVLTDLHGKKISMAASDVRFEQDAEVLADADLILVTVKSADTASAAASILKYGKPGALVISLQNGVGNAEVLRLPDCTVLGGMVPFNVAQLPDGRFHRGTEGELMVQASPALARWRALFAAAGLPLIEREDFAEVQWGKLLLNLNNPVNALSGLPLHAQLSQRSYRRCLALLMDEALSVLRIAGIKPAKIARVAPVLLPTVMRLPDPFFKRLAAAMLRIDPQARSSMWEDLQAGRRTEVDYLNGAVLKLAQSRGRDAPANRRVVDLIRAAESGEHQSLDGDALYRALTM
ncbi:MAG TPA: 2-dehydropantoate 2-reductase [Noviherbaspirillum sp.]|jgi:2-dehydropantoate 2-reductase|uniref:2-dehydropantoate 2-reductase n=1 Tax=Noviherbaspirillum sp. TaxID=1926288 RepID=UPI002DDD9BDE|nr:2-dehydropantoate 2-reductase [Noviherbaspirillum sp.]HEV2611954.1 2-dehydropantoate 2-reductase [Noviherbaspirillum sp.]